MKICVKIVFLLFAFAACNSKPESNNKVTTHTEVEKASLAIPDAGTITQIKIKSDTTQSYSLYVPANRDSNSLLLVFFDPGAKGKKPVEKYKALAERHGIILAGSNNSKNGLSGEESAAIAEKFIQDVQTRFKVKNQNTYACGFSGGARVAVLTAIGENLPGVIGCGAGFPGKPEKNYGFNYVGVVGNEDFNFLELKRLYNELDRVKMKHQLIVFDGKHEWMPETEMEKAILLMKNDVASQNTLAAKIDSSIAVFKKEMNWIRLYDELRLGITSGLDSTHVSAWRTELRSLKKNAAGIADLKKEAEIEGMEAEQQTEIARAYPSKDFTLLTSKIRALSQDIPKKSSLQKLSDKRLLQFISMMSFLYSEKALGSDLSLVKKYLDIYAKADPANPDYHYLVACYQTKAGDKSAAVVSLKKAVDLGFGDLEKIQKNTTLQTLQNEPGFSEIMNQMSDD